MTEPAPELWSDRLQEVLGDRGRVTVLAETASTQDAARRLGARPFDAIVAMRQTAGRGRQGRQWHDPHGDGIAMTLVAPAGRPEYLAMATAVGVAEAAERLLEHPVGIKWPNDVVVDGRKLAGILIELTGGVALIGIGLNVKQQAWPDPLSKLAVSLAQLGGTSDRLAALAAVLWAVNAALTRTPEALVEGYRSRDVLQGTSMRFTTDGRTDCGTVVSVNPMLGLEVETPDGRRFLDAATTTRLPDL